MSLPTSSESPLLPSASPPPSLLPPPVQFGGMVKPPAQTGANITAGFLWRSFQHWWRVAVPAGLVCAALACAVVWATWTPKYKASALIVIPDRAGLLLPTSPDKSPRFAQTQLQTIASEISIGPALSDFGVLQVPEISRQLDPIDYIKKNLTVTNQGQSELYRVEYVGESAEGAATVVNGVLDAYFARFSRVENERRKKLLAKLDELKTKHESEISSQRTRIAKMQGGAVDTTAEERSAAAALDVLAPILSLHQKLIEVESEREVLQAQVAAYGSPPPNKPAEVPADILATEVKLHPDVREHSRLLSAMRMQLEDIEKKSRLGKESTSYKNYAAQVAQAEKDFETLQEDVRTQLKLQHSLATQSDQGHEADDWRQRLTALDAEHAILKRRYDEYRRSLEESSETSAKLKFLYADLELVTGIFEKIASRKLQVETETQEFERIRIEEEAKVPLTPVDSWPYKQMLLFGGAAFVAPFFLVIGWEKLTRRIADAEQLSSEATLTIVGEIAQLPTRPVLAGEAASRRKIRRDLGLFQESVDALRTCLLLSESTGRHRVFAVTSAVSGEGKTSLVSQLAISLSRATGKRTLIVDSDLRSPNLHEIFNARLEPGLAEVLRGECDIVDAVVEEVAEGVHLMPAGRTNTSPHKFLGNGAIPRLMSKLREAYDFVVIDTPPVLCASEAMVMAKAADGTLLCALRDVSRSRQVRLATDRLNMAGVNLMGAVLSGTSARRYAYTYGNYAYLGDSV